MWFETIFILYGHQIIIIIFVLPSIELWQLGSFLRKISETFLFSYVFADFPFFHITSHYLNLGPKVITLFPSDRLVKNFFGRLEKNFSPFFHDLAALFILYFYPLPLYITFIWNDLFISKLVLAIFWMFAVFLKRHWESSWYIYLLRSLN